MSSKREAQRIVKRALKATGLSPERFAAQYGSVLLWDASARTVRRWKDGETQPHPSVMGSLRLIISEANK